MGNVRAFVVYCFFPHYRSGVIKALSKMGPENFTFVGDSRSNVTDIPAFDQWDGLSHRVVRSYRVGNFELQPGLIWRLIRWRKEFDVIIFLGNPNILTTWIGLHICRLLGKKTLLWTHGWLSDDFGLKGLLRKLFYNLADGLLLYGSRARDFGLAKGFDGKKMFVIWNSLDYDSQKKLRDGMSYGNREEVKLEKFGFSCPAIICSARVNSLSAQWLIVEAIQKLKDRGIEVGLVLIGDGDQLPRIRRAVIDRGIKHRFYGALYDESKIASITMACDVTVSPGKVGLTAMQSMAYGVPVISHGTLDLQMPEVEAIIPGVTGDLFCYGDATDLALVIEKWLALLRSHRDEVRSKCIEIIEDRFCPAAQAREICRAVKLTWNDGSR